MPTDQLAPGHFPSGVLWHLMVAMHMPQKQYVVWCARTMLIVEEEEEEEECMLGFLNLSAGGKVWMWDGW